MVDDEADEEHNDDQPEPVAAEQRQAEPAKEPAAVATIPIGDKASRPRTLSEFCADPTGKEDDRLGPTIPKYRQSRCAPPP